MTAWIRPTVFAFLAALIVCVGSVAASSTADAQPGFGFLIAVVALLIAFLIARRKRRQAEAERSETHQRETASSVS